ncbi:MAG: FIST N-terminal domain-containing protein, partial [Methylocella sp.]
MQEQKVFLSGFSAGKDWRGEAAELASKMRQGLGGRSCDLAVFFVSEAFGDLDAEALRRILSDGLRPKCLIGCNASGVIADDKEIEMEPALSVLSMHLPGVKLSPFALSAADANALQTGPELIKFLDLYPTDNPHFLCLADPATCDVSKALTLFNEGYKGLPIIG